MALQHSLVKNSTVIGVLTTVIVAAITFAFTFGSLSTKVSEDRALIDQIQATKVQEIRVTVDQHERRLTIVESKQDTMSKDIAEVKSDVKVIRQILQTPVANQGN